jgi:hypothetical protein
VIQERAGTRENALITDVRRTSNPIIPRALGLEWRACRIIAVTVVPEPSTFSRHGRPSLVALAVPSELLEVDRHIVGTYEAAWLCRVGWDITPWFIGIIRRHAII